MNDSITIDLKSVLRWLLGLLFVWAAVSKLANPTNFLNGIMAYDLPLPDLLLRLAAMALPWLELLCGLALLANAWTESALAAMAVMFVVFIVATCQAWLRGLDIACGCFNLEVFGLKPHSPFVKFIESASFAFFRNLALEALTIFLLVRHINAPSAAEIRRPLIRGSGMHHKDSKSSKIAKKRGMMG